MSHRHIVLASLLAGAVASCSQLPKDQVDATVSQATPDRIDMVELKASSKPLAQLPAARLSRTVTRSPALTPTRRRVELNFAGQGADNGSTATAQSASQTLAPSYPGRPVPAHGESMQTVLADLGQPPHRLPGNSGSEVWDYGTFRVFFQNEKVAFTKVW